MPQILLRCFRVNASWKVSIFEHEPVAEDIRIGRETIGPLVQGWLEDMVPVCLREVRLKP
jgi:hypothetical protein